MHLTLPGYPEGGPTLEIYEYSEMTDPGAKTVNRPGYGHLAFAVDSVQDAQQQILNSGGSSIGEVVTLETKTGSRVTWCYVTDPEANIIELQSWG